MDWIRAKFLLDSRRAHQRNRAKLEHNTYLIRHSDDCVAVRLHSTDIITYYSDGRIALNSGGYETATTKDRMHRYLPVDVRVYSEHGDWFVSFRRQTVGFSSGMVLHTGAGRIEGGTDPEEIYARRRVDPKHRTISEALFDALKAGFREVVA